MSWRARTSGGNPAIAPLCPGLERNKPQMTWLIALPVQIMFYSMATPVREGGCQMGELRLHRVALLLPYVRFLQDVGAPVQRGLRRARVPSCALEDPNNYIPSNNFYTFVAEMARQERLENLGFHVGEYLGADCADPNMVALLSSSPTMLTGLEKACALTNRTISRCEIGLTPSPDGEEIWFFHRPSCSDDNPVASQIAWFGIMVMLGMIRTFAGVGWRPTNIGVMSEGPPSKCIYAVLPDTRIQVGQPFSWVATPTQLLSLPPIVEAGEQQGEGKYCPLETTLSGSLRQLMRSYVLDEIGIDEFAEMLRTTRRSMQRMLMQDGVTFSGLREEVRFEKARGLLSDPDISIADVAHDLGYRHPTHFSRAFRRIAGISPRAYRRMQALDTPVH